MAVNNTLSLNRPLQQQLKKDEPKVEVPAIPVLDERLKYIQVRDLARPNVRYQQGANLFDKSKKFVAEAAFGVEIPTKRKAKEEPKEERQVVVRDRGPRANGSSSRKVLSVTELKEQVKNAKAKAATPEAVLKARQENRRAEAAEQHAG